MGESPSPLPAAAVGRAEEKQGSRGKEGEGRRQHSAPLVADVPVGPAAWVFDVAQEQPLPAQLVDTHAHAAQAAKQAAHSVTNKIPHSYVS